MIQINKGAQTKKKKKRRNIEKEEKKVIGKSLKNIEKTFINQHSIL